MTVGHSTARVLRGEDDLSTWDEQELEYGVRRLSNGRWPPKPKVVAKDVHDEFVRRRMTKAVNLLRTSTVKAVQLLAQVVDDEDATYRDRIAAAKLIIDRTLPAIQPVDLHLSTETLEPWQLMMADAIVSTEDQIKALPAGEVVDVHGEKADAIEWLPHGPVSPDWELDDTPPPEVFEEAKNSGAWPEGFPGT